jgi:hypothetical protein
MSSIHKRDQRAFEALWSKIVVPQIEGLLRPGIELRPSAKRDVWDAYVAFNLHASKHYLKGEGKLDRHKVSACYTYAFVAAMPLIVDEEHAALHLNDRLATLIGCTVLANFDKVAIRHLDALTDAEKRRAIARIKQGVRFPRMTGHDVSYEESFACCLCFTQIEQNYNIPLLSMLFFDWEIRLMDSRTHQLVIRYYREQNKLVG